MGKPSRGTSKDMRLKANKKQKPKSSSKRRKKRSSAARKSPYAKALFHKTKPVQSFSVPGRASY